VRRVPLWTDDHLLYELTKGYFPIQRCWTQAVFLWAERKGFIDRQRNSRAAARMLRLGYYFTSLNMVIVLDTCEAALWRVEDPDLTAILAGFGNQDWDREVTLALTVSTVTEVWQKAPSEEHAKGITNRLIVHLVTRLDGRSIIEALYQNVNQLLGLQAIRSRSLRRLLGIFLKTGAVPL